MNVWYAMHSLEGKGEGRRAEQYASVMAKEMGRRICPYRYLCDEDWKLPKIILCARDNEAAK